MFTRSVRFAVEKIKNNRLLSVGILLALIVVGYFCYQKFRVDATDTRYALAAVEKGTLIVSVSGTGQVSASNQVDIKTKASGEVLSAYVKAGQEVKSGTLLAQLDSQDAQKSVRDAQSSLDSANLSMTKLQQPATQLSLTQSENALANAQQAKVNDQDDLSKAYEDAFTNISNAFLDLPTVITGVQDLLYKTTYNSSQSNLSYYNDLVKKYDENVSIYRDNADSSYQGARTAYDKNFLSYKAASRSDSEVAIETLLNETYNTARLASDSVKNTDNFLSFVKDRLTEHNDNLPSQITTHQASITTYTSKANATLSNLLNSITAIRNAKDTLVSDDLMIKEKTESLASLKAGTDALDIQSQELSIQQKKNTLLDAKATLANYSIRAPFDGVVAAVSIKKGDSASSATSAFTFITKQKLAGITLNEVDVAKVKVGQKATLIFDAIEDLSITGEVAEVDAIGAASQGVVSYGVKINFDTQDERVKSGMSLAAAIIVESKTDVLLVSSSAVKSSGGQSYVQVLSNLDTSSLDKTAASAGITSKNPLAQQAIQVGSVNDTQTEVVSGLAEGDWVVTKTTTAASATAVQASQSTRQAGGAFQMLH